MHDQQNIKIQYRVFDVCMYVRASLYKRREEENN